MVAAISRSFIVPIFLVCKGGKRLFDGVVYSTWSSKPIYLVPNRHAVALKPLDVLLAALFGFVISSCAARGCDPSLIFTAHASHLLQLPCV
jgi:hypothetical protein